MIAYKTSIVEGILFPFVLITCLAEAKGCYHECYQNRISDCRGYQEMGHKLSGVYQVTPRNMQPHDVYCDMTTDGGGWLVFQRRVNGSVDFNRGWDVYERGFGSVEHEHWLGLELIKRLLQQDHLYELRIDLEDWEGNKKYAKYDRFWINEYTDKYRMTVRMYTGTAGDSLTYHSGQMFSTVDDDNDQHAANCAATFTGGWWFNGCKKSNLNGRYFTVSPASLDDCIHWYHWKGFHYSLKSAEMKIRRQ